MIPVPKRHSRVWTHRLLADCEGLEEQRLGFVGVAGISEHTREIAHGAGRSGMLGAERLFVYRQRALEERPRARKVALGLEQVGEVVEARCSVAMLGSPNCDMRCV